MRHRVKKIRFKMGKDAVKMLTRKLVVNFLTRGKIETTYTRAKVTKTLIEKIVEKAKEKNEANKNYILSHTGEEKMVGMLFDQIGPVLKDKTGGYVRLVKVGQRESDGALVARLEWVYPVVLEQPAKTAVKPEKPKTDAKKTVKNEK